MGHLDTPEKKMQFTMIHIMKVIKHKLPEYKSQKNSHKLKDDNSIVTIVDMFINDLVIREVQYCLKQIDSSFVLNIISEELEHDSTTDYNNGYTLVLDPLDGTENFFSGMLEWGVCISIYKDGKHFYSAILLPELNILIDSILKIKRNDKSRITGLSSSLTIDDLIAFNKSEQYEEYRIVGCAAYNLYSFITGAYKKFINVKGVNTWDVLAGLNIMLANGLTPNVNGENYKGELLLPTQKYKLVLE